MIESIVRCKGGVCLSSSNKKRSAYFEEDEKDRCFLIMVTGAASSEQ